MHYRLFASPERRCIRHGCDVGRSEAHKSKVPIQADKKGQRTRAQNGGDAGHGPHSLQVNGMYFICVHFAIRWSFGIQLFDLLGFL